MFPDPHPYPKAATVGGVQGKAPVVADPWDAPYFGGRNVFSLSALSDRSCGLGGIGHSHRSRRSSRTAGTVGSGKPAPSVSLGCALLWGSCLLQL